MSTPFILIISGLYKSALANFFSNALIISFGNCGDCSNNLSNSVLTLNRNSEPEVLLSFTGRFNSTRIFLANLPNAIDEMRCPSSSVEYLSVW